MGEGSIPSGATDKDITLDQKARKQRREQIASDIAKGRSVGDVANEYGVSEPLIRSACREHGVRIPVQRSIQRKSFDIVRDIMLGTDRSEIAKKYGVTRQHVHNIINNLKNAGLERLINNDAVKSLLYLSE